MLSRGVHSKVTSMDREAIEYLSSIQKLPRWIEIMITSIEKRSSRGSIDSLAVKRYRKLLRLLKNSFSKKRKTQTWMQSNMLLNQRSKQNIKLSKTSLIKKNVKHLDPKHTHTLNKSNQFYISKTSLDSLVSTH